MRLRGETNAVCIASGHNRRVQGCRQGPDTSHRSLAMELRPLGLPPWCVDQQLQSPSPGRNGRYGARDDAQHPQPCGPGTIHGADPRAPLPRLGARATASRRAAPVRLRQCECGCVSGSGPSGPRSPRRRGSSSLEQKGPRSAQNLKPEFRTSLQTSTGPPPSRGTRRRELRTCPISPHPEEALGRLMGRQEAEGNCLHQSKTGGGGSRALARKTEGAGLTNAAEEVHRPDQARSPVRRSPAGPTA